jgi:P27 family predicted phage terminase small subunit
MDKRYKQKQEQIEEFLKRKGVKEGIDDTMIEELIFNLKLADEAKEQIYMANGKPELLINTSKKPDEPYYQANPVIKVYNDAFKTIRSISISLGLTPADRHKLGLSTIETVDELDDIIG